MRPSIGWWSAWEEQQIPNAATSTCSGSRKKLEPFPTDQQTDDIKVKGCVSQVFVRGTLADGVMLWQGDSDALITKGLLALLIQGLNGLSPKEVQAVDPAFIAATGLQTSLTPSRANGFLNILRAMQAQASQLDTNTAPMDS